VTGRNQAGDWLAIETADGALVGWVAAYYLRLGGDLGEFPVIQSSEVESAVEPAAATTTPLLQAQPLASVGSVTAASVQSTVGAGLEGTLVFQTGQGGTIYAYDLDSTRLWPLTNGFDPAISPDGATVAFARVGNDAGLYLINIDGGNERQIYSGPSAIASPKWSEDGAQIAFSYATSARECRDMGGGNCVSDDQFGVGRLKDEEPNDYPLTIVYTYDIGVVSDDGGSFHSLSALDSVRTLDWGPGGIVYQSSDGIQMISPQGGGSRVVLFDPLKQVDQDPEWVGGRIVFQRPGASHWQIWSADANGATPSALTQPQTVLVNQLPSSVSPASSPDGDLIAFVSNRSDDGEAGDWRLWVMNADGSNQHRLPIDVPINYTFGAEQMVSWGR
jgi:Tol biopolymer transport system component